MRLFALSSLAAGAVLASTSLAAASGPPLHSNSELYRTRNAPAATGRSGNASLAERALMNKNGTTDVNITTGTLDSSATAPGNIKKVQIKTYNGAGDVQWAKNFSSLTSGGSLAYNFPDLHRGQPIQTQGNIDGIDKRTDVVTVTGNVKLRPDIAVEEVKAPAKATVGTHVNISGVVAELNGDVGARGDCVLSVDGTQVSSTLGIYVDSGSTVSCAFNYKFDTVGTHTLQVSVGNVVPGDWDTANNSATTTIQIVPNTAPFYYSAWANLYEYKYSYSNSGSYQYNDGTYAVTQDWGNSYGRDDRWEGAGISGWSPSGVTFPINATLSQTSDGTVVDSHVFANLAADWTWGDSSYGGGAVQRFDPATYTYFYLSTYNFGGYGSTSAEYYRYAGEVTYFDNAYNNYWNNYQGTVYSWAYNYDYTYQYGQPWPIGARYNISFAVTDATGLGINASPTLATQPYAYGQYDNGPSCSSYTWTWGSEQYCSENHFFYGGTSGYANGVSQ